MRARSWCLELSPQLCPNLLVERSPPKEHPCPAPLCPEVLPAYRVHGETGSIPVQGAAKFLQLVVNPVTLPGSGQG